MHFWKVNGAGNDFIILSALTLDLTEERFSALAKHLCHRRRSIGADGLMVVLPPEGKADFRMLFFNADGTKGEMCGNGARCICRFGYELGLSGEKQTIETTAGIITGKRLSEREYRIRLNDVTLTDLNHRVEVDGIRYDCAYVELGTPGVPHSVTEYRGDLWGDSEKLWQRMHDMRYHPAFPKGANVNFYQWIGEAEVRVLTFERGVEDYTLACGTGTGSIACTLWMQGKLPGGYLTAHNRGGTLAVTIEGNAGAVTSIELEGPTEVVHIYDV